MTKQESSKYLGNQAWILLHYAHDMITRIEENTFLQEAGISYQHFMVLMVMESIEKPVKEAKLALILKRNPNSVSTLTDRMEKLGLVTKTRSRTDRRLVQIEITPTGEDKFKQGFQVGNDLVQRLMHDFSVDELNFLVKLLDKVAVYSAREIGLKENPAEFAIENIKNLVNSVKKNH